MAVIRGDATVDSTATAQRFFGAQLRARLSPRTAIEVSLDRRSEEDAAEGAIDTSTRVKDYPLQASLLLFPVRTTFSPYVLGGIGWYTHVVESLIGRDVAASESTRKVGYHLGFGAELALGRHAAVDADYRYTFVHFGDGSGTSSGTNGLASHLLPSYDGSMWTAGVTFYF